MRVFAWPRSPRKITSWPGEQRVLELRQDRVLVALHDHREERLARLDAGDGVAPQLLLHRHRGPARLAELADRGGRGVRGSRGHGGQPIAGPRVAVQAPASGTVSAVRLRWFLTMTTILAATVGAHGARQRAASTEAASGSDQVVARPRTTGDHDHRPPPPRLGGRRGRCRSAARSRRVHLDGAVLDPREVATPLTITADRGFGNGGRITGVLVDGTPATIEWDAGRPFVLSSGGALVLDPVRMDLAPEGLRLSLADGVHAVRRRARYQLDTPVAVGTSGVAGARESVAFEADDGATLRGRGATRRSSSTADQPRRLLGPGRRPPRGHPRAHRRLRHARRSRVSTPPTGAFDLTLTPAPGGGWTVEGRLGGDGHRAPDRYPRCSMVELGGTWRAAVADDDLRRTWHEDAFDDAGLGGRRGAGPLALGRRLRRHRRPAALPALLRRRWARPRAAAPG